MQDILRSCAQFISETSPKTQNSALTEFGDIMHVQDLPLTTNVTRCVNMHSDRMWNLCIDIPFTSKLILWLTRLSHPSTWLMPSNSFTCTRVCIYTQIQTLKCRFTILCRGVQQWLHAILSHQDQITFAGCLLKSLSVEGAWAGNCSSVMVAVVFVVVRFVISNRCKIDANCL